MTYGAGPTAIQELDDIIRSEPSPELVIISNILSRIVTKVEGTLASEIDRLDFQITLLMRAQPGYSPPPLSSTSTEPALLLVDPVASPNATVDISHTFHHHFSITTSMLRVFDQAFKADSERLFETLATAQLHVDESSLQVSRLVHQLSDNAVPRLSPDQIASSERINDPANLDPSPLIRHLRSAHYLGRDYVCPFGPTNAYNDLHSAPYICGNICDYAQVLHLLATDLTKVISTVVCSLSSDIALLKGTVAAAHSKLRDQFQLLHYQGPAPTILTHTFLNIMD